MLKISRVVLFLIALGISSCSPSKTEQCASLWEIINKPGKEKQTKSYYLNESKATKEKYEKLNLSDKDLDQIRKRLVENENVWIAIQEGEIASQEKAQSIENEFARLEFKVSQQAYYTEKTIKAVDNHTQLRNELKSFCPLSQ